MSTNVQGISQSNNRALRNPWVIGWITLILVVLSVNVAFIVTAIKTNPGLVDKDYYEKGRQYERTIQDKIAARNALNWTTQLDVPDGLARTQPATIGFGVVDENGVPLRNLKLTLVNYRPSDASADFSSEMTEVAPGQYQAKVNYALKGLWEVTVRVQHADQSIDLLNRRISIAE